MWKTSDVRQGLNTCVWTGKCMWRKWRHSLSPRYLAGMVLRSSLLNNMLAYMLYFFYSAPRPQTELLILSSAPPQMRLISVLIAYTDTSPRSPRSCDNLPNCGVIDSGIAIPCRRQPSLWWRSVWYTSLGTGRTPLGRLRLPSPVGRKMSRPYQLSDGVIMMNRKATVDVDRSGLAES